jgi:predicted Holliday junction resolvase-like endonuclease
MEVPALLIKLTLGSWAILLVSCYILFLYARWKGRQAALERAKTVAQIGRNRSLSTRYGQITEQFLPLVDAYPYNPKNFRFLGSPIDGVQFEEDRIVIVEFKSAGSKLSKNQKRIRDLVKSRKVDFELAA